MHDISPSRRNNVRATDLDGEELEFIFSISKKLYRCPGCGNAIDVGREHTLIKFLTGPRARSHQHWHKDCATEAFGREVRNTRKVPAR